MRPEPPTWIDARTVPEKAWARAWEAVDESRRTLLKTCLAVLCNAYAPAVPAEERLESVSRQGVRLTRRTRPLDWALVLFDSGCSAEQLLAAAAPARLMGLERVAAAFLGRRFPEDALCGLELAGVEEAYRLSGREAVELVKHLFATGPGVLLGVGDSAGLDKALCAAPRDSVWQGRPGDLAVETTGEAAAENVVGTASFPGLRLGPGHERTWLWPGLSPERFLSTSLAVSASGGGRS